METPFERFCDMIGCCFLRAQFGESTSGYEESLLRVASSASFGGLVMDICANPLEKGELRPTTRSRFLCRAWFRPMGEN